MCHVATSFFSVQATVCARFGLKCIIYMGAKDMERQALNVFRMRLMGAEVRPVTYGTATLKDATSEAIRDWVTNVETTHYILGSAAGPHPYPMMVSRRLCWEASAGRSSAHGQSAGPVAVWSTPGLHSVGKQS